MCATSWPLLPNNIPLGYTVQGNKMMESKLKPGTEPLRQNTNVSCGPAWNKGHRSNHLCPFVSAHFNLKLRLVRKARSVCRCHISYIFLKPCIYSQKEISPVFGCFNILVRKSGAMTSSVRDSVVWEINPSENGRLSESFTAPTWIAAILWDLCHRPALTNGSVPNVVHVNMFPWQCGFQGLTVGL